MFRLYTIFLIVFCACTLPAQTLENGQSIYIYSDGYFDGAIKDLYKQTREQLKKKDIKWKQKSDRKASWIELANTTEKTLLSKEADYYVLSLGFHDIWDKKGTAAHDYDKEKLNAAIDSVINALTKADKTIILYTPHQLLEGTNAEAEQHTQTLSTLLTAYAEQENVILCDARSLFAQKTASAEPAKYGKGINTKDGYKLNDSGESLVKQLLSSALDLSSGGSGKKLEKVELKKKDYIVIACGFHAKFPKASFNEASKLKYDEKMPFESPRMAATALRSLELAREGTAQALLQQKANYYILQPSIEYISPQLSKSYHDGSYETQFIALIREMKKSTDAEIFLLTQAPANENTVKNDFVVGGDLYKISSDHAEMVRKIAKLTNCPVIDFHQRCLDYAKGKTDLTGIRFNGERNKLGSYMGPINGSLGMDILKQEITDLFGVSF